MHPTIILDRDGVINFESPESIKSPNEWIPIPGSLEAIATLNQAGFRVSIATNQSGIAKGLYTEKTLDAIHNKLRTALKAAGGWVDKIAFCPHGPMDSCLCRKPKPGLLQNILQYYRITPSSSHPVYMIGDSLRDIEAAKQADCLPILVLTGNGENTLKQNPSLLSDVPVYKTLKDTLKHFIH